MTGQPDIGVKPYYSDKWRAIYLGDCRAVVSELSGISAVVTDPPYELGFMGKSWDSKGVSFQSSTWSIIRQFCLSGAPLLSFGGSRTQHRIACAIEDAGWEIRDCLMYVYGSGFPKSLNISKQLQKKSNCGNMEVYGLQRTEPKTQYYLRLVPEANIQKGFTVNEAEREILQSCLQEQGLSESGETAPNDGRSKPSLEGRSDIEASQRELQRCQVCQMFERISGDGTQRWLCHGAPFGYGTSSWSSAPQDRDCPSYRPRSSEQQDRQSYAIPHEQSSQDFRRLAELWNGWGTALKPAYEPIILAMNPLDGTFANNALKHGVAGLSIDGCRVPTSEYLGRVCTAQNPTSYSLRSKTEYYNNSDGKGRFPANFLHDGSQEVVELFPITNGGGKPQQRDAKARMFGGKFRPEYEPYDDTRHGGGSAARFFYCAKASRSERDSGCEGMVMKKSSSMSGRRNPYDAEWDTGNDVTSRFVTERRNTHPTVKPLALMEYLCKLVKMPEYNLILDPFCGSGTTLLACCNLGIKSIGIDSDEKSCEIAASRCATDTIERIKKGEY